MSERRSPLAIHPQTQRQLAMFANDPPQAVVFVGTDGVGKGIVARSALAQILNLPPEKIDGCAYFLPIGSEGESISIDAIRGIRQFLRLKTAGEQSLRRAVLIEHANSMTIEAQNALLKMLEEPPADTIVALTATNTRTLLPTITSRLQTITVRTPSEQMLRDYFASQTYDDTAITQAYFLSGGLPGLMQVLLKDGEAHPLLASVNDVKALLRQTTFERLAQVDRLSKQKEAALQLLDALTRTAQAGLSQAARRADNARLKQWQHVLAQALHAQQALKVSANTKLTLTNLMLQL